MQLAGGKTWGQTFHGGKLLFPCREKKIWERDVPKPKSAAYAVVLAMQLHLQQRNESLPVSAMGNLWASLDQRTDDLEGPGEKGAMASLAIPTANDIWKVVGKTMKQRGKEEKLKRTCRRLLQHVRKLLGRHLHAFVHGIPSHYYS